MKMEQKERSKDERGTKGASKDKRGMKKAIKDEKKNERNDQR
jgi:hypothetical protein